MTTTTADKETQIWIPERDIRIAEKAQDFALLIAWGTTPVPEVFERFDGYVSTMPHAERAEATRQLSSFLDLIRYDSYPTLQFRPSFQRLNEASMPVSERLVSLLREQAGRQLRTRG